MSRHSCHTEHAPFPLGWGDRTESIDHVNYFILIFPLPGPLEDAFPGPRGPLTLKKQMQRLVGPGNYYLTGVKYI